MTTVEYVLESYCNHVHVVVGIYTACDAETEKIEAAETVLTSHRVTVCEDITDLATTDTSLKVKLDGECLSRELLLRDIAEHLVSVYEESVTTYRSLVRDSELVKTCSEVLYLTDTCLDVVKLSILVKTYSKSSHITAVHTTISKITLERNTESLCSLVPVLMTCSDETSHINETVLL
jgi:hypothetical protein